MKYIFLFFVLFLSLSCTKNDLTDKEILEIIHSDENYNSLQLRSNFIYGEDFIDSIKSFKKIITKENPQSIFKADLNGDEKQDYLVNLEYEKDTLNQVVMKPFVDEHSKNCVILLSSPTGYRILNAGKKRVYNIFSAKIINYKGQNLIKLLNFKAEFMDKNNILKFDTLMVKNNQLTEFVKIRSNNNVSKITFTQFGGYAPGIYYTLSLKRDSIILNSKLYKKLDGKYLGNNKLDFENLALYLNNLDFKNLKDRYAINCSDCPAREIKIVYDSGKSKTVYDYGEKGSLGLLKFYDAIKVIMEKQKWKKIE
ncbi:DUF6438 domain-containing protein [Chryseobacterium sp. MP_3.2]|uniref:DUF6438 domain-containing protein n=1 Tax=Chryseobacterium sp. MP_3.2 TaxID=3071712 RepID=UPI002E0A0AB2|nr:hypothetical protein [Chryseobacterium sp. MP_3.2]